ncbi:hypothetical protein AVW11_03800 [Streptomyces amritsarensis]|uniref:Beta sliding clamp n=1 Tax=Streptomyces amritsarensis TaxID=681158 RepID=A0ABX3G8Q3_9ACTN|nr:DNA polymerase III subunit beta [Streptomyces amritsarensis]OLZ72526.1 hypothetical protein AVW11_03800 [Streptomyces amritsarensis]
MHVTIPQQELAPAVAWAAKQLPAKPLNPVLAGMRLHAADGRLQLSVWDGTTAAHADVNADTAGPGTVIAPGQMLQHIVGALRKGEVTFTDASGELEISTPGAHFALSALDDRDYPVLPSMPDATGSVDGAEFAAAFKRVKTAMDPKADGAFAGMGGIRLRIDAGVLSLTATDRYRIATATLPWTSDQPVTAMGVFPGKTLADNAAAIDGRLHLTLPADGTGTAALSGARRQVSTMLIDPTLFPHKVDQLAITKSGRIVGDAGDFAEAVRAAMAVTEPGKPVWINASPDRVTLRAGRDARSVIEVDAQYEGDHDEFEAAFNSVYLLDGLAPLGGVVHLELSTPKTPALIHDPGDDTYRYVVVPIRDPHKSA